ncbi:hypothetical protein COLO4_14219 [Corchorus olitorius]|uniref:Uncharacterized protein n=1 Tax=Corchorus olitorius TaxID=93759 RepID=A0A1R3JTF3_9ROSI|nr:hypothetical protein COLO4_14219 [Corchorus olitorius]
MAHSVWFLSPALQLKHTKEVKEEEEERECVAN